MSAFSRHTLRILNIQHLRPRANTVVSNAVTTIFVHHFNHKRQLMDLAHPPLHPRPADYLHHIPSPPCLPITPQIQAYTTQLLNSLYNNTAISHLDPPPTHQDAYQTTLSLLHARHQTRNERAVGRKIGFTNKSIWPTHNIDRPIWSYMYDSSVSDVSSRQSAPGVSPEFEVDIGRFSNLQPRIEPEIVFGLSDAKPVSAGMGDEELLGCVDWIAAGVEVVISPFADWRFGGVNEAVAAFGLHARLLVGDRVRVEELGSVERVLKMLEEFRVELVCDGVVVDEGSGRNVLESPVKALGHLVRVLEADQWNPRLALGEVITTGTLTKALPVTERVGGERWEVRVMGLGGVQGVKCRFVF